MDLLDFFKENNQLETKEVVISSRFCDKQGSPIKFTLQAVFEESCEEIKKVSKNQEEFLARLCGVCVKYPDLNNANLLGSYKVFTAHELIKKMLLAGEYDTLCKEVLTICGFNQTVEELSEDIKK